MGLVPMDLGFTNASIDPLNRRTPFHLSPAPRSKLSPELRQSPNRSTGRNNLAVSDWTNNFPMHRLLMPLPKKRLDRIVNIILAIHPARQHLFLVPQMLVQDVDEVAGAVGAGDLAVAEHVAGGEDLFL